MHKYGMPRHQQHTARKWKLLKRKYDENDGIFGIIARHPTWMDRNKIMEIFVAKIGCTKQMKGEGTHTSKLIESNEKIRLMFEH